jgi:hypothetical protein
MKKFVRVKTTVWSDIEVGEEVLADVVEGDVDAVVRTHVTDWTLDEIAERATYFETEVVKISDTELEPEEH